MTSDLNKFDILRKNKKWNSISPEQEKIMALASVVDKIKDDNLKLSKSFKSSPPGNVKGKGKGKRKGKGKGKGKGKVKVQGKKPPGKITNMEKGKRSGRIRNQNMERPTPIKWMIRLNFGVQRTRHGPSINPNNSSSMRRTRPPILPTSSARTPILWTAPYPSSFRKSTVRRSSDMTPAVFDTGSGWAFLRLTLSLIVPTCFQYY